MEKIVGYCGIVCTECPAFLATINNDDEARKTTADTWSKEFNADIKSEDINCDGCHSKKGVLFTHCTVCEIRNCGLTKEITTCADCKDYTCQKLADFHKMAPAKNLLDSIKAN